MKRKLYLNRKILITTSVIILLLFWRYNFLIFVPNLAGLPQASKAELSPAANKALFVRTDTNENYGGVINSDTTLHDVKTVSVKGTIYDERSFIFKSSNGWSRVFNNYYSGYGIEAANNDYFVVAFGNASDWNPTSLGGPPFLLNFQVNRAKKKWHDVYIVNRKNGATFKHYRYNDGLLKVFYDNTSKAFYFRTYESYYYLKVK